MKANAMWGGRFKNSPDEIMEKINASIDYDKKLYKQDIAGSKAHCNMLVVQSIISQEDGDKIIAGLDQVEKEIESGEFIFSAALEDIHMNVEARLTEIVGDVGGKLHTARSRNDQVATDFKLWVRDNLDALDEAISELQKELLVKAEEHAGTFMPGYTHLQTAQPVTFGHHLLAYFEMLKRDRSRVVDARKRLNECPLGSAALAGTSFPIDREMTAELLGFDRPTANSLDAVSDRDFALEYLNVASICAVHLSRLAEELVIWSSSEFSFIKMSDSFTSGSSIMPQKRNPDAAELVRAKVGRITGNNVTLLIVMKGLPLAYSKDMQEDKEPVFDTADSIMLCVNAMTGMIKDLQINKENMSSSAGAGFSTATDIADWLVKNLGIPFRRCHHITGEVVQLAEEKNCSLEELELKDLQKIEPRITDGIYGVLSVENSVNSRTSFGGTAINNVSESIKKAVY